jgi:hypothetical protein
MQALPRFLIVSRVWLGIAFVPPLFCMSHYFFMFATIGMILFLISFMFLIIMFIVYFDYILSIARWSFYSSISSYSTHTNDHGVSGRYYVSVVLIHCLPMDTPYILHHGCDTPVESYVVHSPNIGQQVGSSYKGRHALFLIFLSNIPYV